MGALRCPFMVLGLLRERRYSVILQGAGEDAEDSRLRAAFVRLQCPKMPATTPALKAGKTIKEKRENN